jgi:hypothetical protein
MRCPICGSSAKDITPRESGYASIRCLVDGDFEIDAGCQRELFELTESDRHRVFHGAILSGLAGSRPRITMAAIVGIQATSRECRRDAIVIADMDSECATISSK